MTQMWHVAAAYGVAAVILAGVWARAAWLQRRARRELEELRQRRSGAFRP